MENVLVGIVTGGSSGIGFSTAKKLVVEGIDVIIVGRNKINLQKATTELKSLGKIEYIQADVSKENEVQGLVKTIIQKKGRIDFLINCAGGNEFLSTEIGLEEAEKIWTRVIDANLKSAFMMSVALSQYMTPNQGRIVNISSIGAFTGGSSAGAIAYSAAKSGILGLTRALARELITKGITVNAVAPGLIYPTNFFGKPIPDNIMDNYKSQIPAKRPGTPEEVANAIFFLLSKDSGYITGEVLNINGGWLFGR